TLSTSARQATRRQASIAAAPITGVSVSEPGLNALPAFNPILLTPADGNFPSPSAGPRTVVALSTFLDWRGSARSNEPQEPEPLPVSDEADEVFAAFSHDSHAQAADEPGMGSESVENRNGSGWTNLMNLLFVVSLSMTWTCWLRHLLRVPVACR